MRKRILILFFALCLVILLPGCAKYISSFTTSIGDFGITKYKLVDTYGSLKANENEKLLLLYMESESEGTELESKLVGYFINKEDGQPSSVTAADGTTYRVNTLSYDFDPENMDDRKYVLIFNVPAATAKGALTFTLPDKTQIQLRK